ncbi:MAG: hypothetical protein HC888_08220 [Candidatus Competibacteraceae bacterium]|nr:hypothetical protein [Candidatus Competibacteraceae bacterium]
MRGSRTMRRSRSTSLYDRELYQGWRRVEHRAIADGGKVRTEVLWLSPNVVEKQMSLFGCANE